MPRPLYMIFSGLDLNFKELERVATDQTTLGFADGRQLAQAIEKRIEKLEEIKDTVRGIELNRGGPRP